MWEYSLVCSIRNLIWKREAYEQMSLFENKNRFQVMPETDLLFVQQLAPKGLKSREIA